MSSNNNNLIVLCEVGEGLLTVIIDGNPHTFSEERHKNLCKKLREAYVNGDTDAVISVVDKLHALNRYSGGELVIKNKCVSYKGEVLPVGITNKILELNDQDLPFSHFVAFWDRLSNNESYTCRESLYRWTHDYECGITADGMVQLYKGVNFNPYKGKSLDDAEVKSIYARQSAPMEIDGVTLNDPYLDDELKLTTFNTFKELLKTRPYIDVHSTTFPQGVGDIVQVPRRYVDDEKGNQCSAGLHVANLEYVKNFPHSTTLVVLVDPADWVTVPEDSSKVRVCRYQIASVMQSNNDSADTEEE